MSEKQELRVIYKAKRRELKDEKKDEIIAGWVKKNFDFPAYFVYLSFQSEVGTEPFIKLLKSENKEICVPLVRGKDMLSVPLTKGLKRGAFGIMEPEEGEEKICPVAIVPMLAFDKEGYRLGYGGGYYDRFFASHPDVFRLGIAYEGQFCEESFREGFDEPLDALVTEMGVRLFSKRAKEKFDCGS